MDDPFISIYIEDLLTKIRTQVSHLPSSAVKCVQFSNAMWSICSDRTDNGNILFRMLSSLAVLGSVSLGERQTYPSHWALRECEQALHMQSMVLITMQSV